MSSLWKWGEGGNSPSISVLLLRSRCHTDARNPARSYILQGAEQELEPGSVCGPWARFAPSAASALVFVIIPEAAVGNREVASVLGA